MPEAASATPGRPDDALSCGTPVDVRTRYLGAWSRGFEVAEQVAPARYRVRRLSDGTVLPDVFEEQDLRPQRRRQEPWY